jgi:hypothetical protein
MAVELPASDEVAQGELSQNLGTAVLDRLERDERPGKPRRREHPAEAEAGSEAFARRTDKEHSIGGETLKRANRRSVVAKLAVVVILDYEAIAPLCPVEERSAPVAGQSAAGRELMGGRHDHRGRVRSLEGRNIDALRVYRDGDGCQTGLLSDEAVLVPTRLLDGDALYAVASQPSTNQ